MTIENESSWRVDGVHIVDDLGRHIASTRNHKQATRIITEIERLRTDIERLARRLSLDFEQRYKVSIPSYASYQGVDMEHELILLEKLTQAASKYVHGKSGEPLAGQSLEEARRKLIACVDEAYDYLQGPKTDD